jgi:hypothetical protein
LVIVLFLIFVYSLNCFLMGTLGVIAREDLVSLTASYFFWLESILTYLKHAATAMHIGLGPNLLGMQQDPVSLVITAS